MPAIWKLSLTFLCLLSSYSLLFKSICRKVEVQNRYAFIVCKSLVVFGCEHGLILEVPCRGESWLCAQSTLLNMPLTHSFRLELCFGMTIKVFLLSRILAFLYLVFLI